MGYSYKQRSQCEMCGSERLRPFGLRLNSQTGRFPRRAKGVTVAIVKCRDCGLVFPNPQPIPASIEDHYGRPPAEYWSAKRLVFRDTYFRKQIATAKALIGFKPGMRALDIGAGVGKAMRAMQVAGFDVEGIEPSSDFREHAISAMGIEPGKLQHASIETANFGPDSFDFISFGAVLEHLYEPAEAIERALSWLRPGGIIHIEVPSSRHLLSKILNGYYRLWGTNYVTNTSPMHRPYHLWEFDDASFEAHGRRAGYRIAKREKIIGGIRHLPGVTRPALRWLMRNTDTEQQLIVWLTPAAKG